MAGLDGVPARERGVPDPAISIRKAKSCVRYRDRLNNKPGDDDGE
jgi:hypothetical protein